MLNDTLADALTAIKNAEMKGKGECNIRLASKLIGRILKVMQDEGYIGPFEWIDDGKAGQFKVQLIGNINKCGVIKPRHAIKKDEFEKWERRYLPAKSLGILILTSTQGIISQKEAGKEGIGGRLVAYVF